MTMATHDIQSEPVTNSARYINITEATIAKLNVRPGDVVVLSCEKVVTTELAHHIRQFFAHYMPEVKVVVLDRGLKLAVLSRQPEADQPIEVDAPAVCDCGLPITADSCPRCGTWHDLAGRR